jgi:hypothetical protein
MLNELIALLMILTIILFILIDFIGLLIVMGFL